MWLDPENIWMMTGYAQVSADCCIGLLRSHSGTRQQDLRTPKHLFWSLFVPPLFPGMGSGSEPSKVFLIHWSINPENIRWEISVHRGYRSEYQISDGKYLSTEDTGVKKPSGFHPCEVDIILGNWHRMRRVSCRKPTQGWNRVLR